MLPNTPSALIRLALDDLRKCESEPDKWKIVMSQWYTYSHGEPCAVCLAGAVMAQTLGNGPESKTPDHYPVHANKLRALDCLRVGNIRVALATLGMGTVKVGAIPGCFCRTCYKPPEGVELRVHVTQYNEDKEQFHSDMNALATYLEGVGY